MLGARVRTLHLVFILLWSSLVNSYITSPNNFLPASYPLAVKTPYLNAWVYFGNSSNVTSSAFPNHWTNTLNMGLTGYARVDGVPWHWLGANVPGNGTQVLSSEITPTQTRFSLLAGPMILNVTFLSPIEPSDWVKQSFPFMYVSFEATSIDGKPHDLQVYSDVTAEWLSSDRDKNCTWNTTQRSTSVYHQAQLQSPSLLSETGNVALDSTVYYSMQTIEGMTYQTGPDIPVRGQFGSHGVLTKEEDTDFRAIDNGYVVLGFSVDLGHAAKFTTPVVWGLGLIRDPVIQYTPQAGMSPSQSQNRSSYFYTQFHDIGDAIDDFLADYPNAAQRANTLDLKIMNEATNISSNYADLVALGARQAMANSEITVARDNDGNFDLSDVKAFQRNTGIDTQINSVETLFAAMPAFLYLNASLLGIHLESLLQYQSSVNSSAYAASDLGSSFPVADGDAYGMMGVEDTGSMLIMSLAHARSSGDGTLIKKYYDLLKTWADYLVSHTLYPTNQSTVDGLRRANMTNLAIKGIIGIAAMGQISNVMGKADDAQQYSANASLYVKIWEQLASSSGHLLPTYGESNASAYALMYNMYADRLLQTNLIDQSVYDSQATYYSNLAQSDRFGLMYDTDLVQRANSGWTLFAAASVSGTTATRDQLISMVHTRPQFNETASNFPTSYDTSSGIFLTQASPGQGAMFALLALNVVNQTIRVPPASITGSDSVAARSGKSIIIGTVVGSLSGLALVAASFLLWRRRRQRITKQEELASEPCVLESTVASHRTYSQAVSTTFGSKMVANSEGGSTQTDNSKYSNNNGSSTELESLRREVAQLRRDVAPPDYAYVSRSGPS